MMASTQRLHELGQSLWLDNITRDMLGDGTLRRYIDELSITGLTSNPTIFDKAISGRRRLRRADHRAQASGPASRSRLFFELALADLRDAARMFESDQRAHRRRRRLGLAGGLARCSPTTRRRRSRRSAELHARAERPNIFIKIPGTPEGREAIEESIFAGIPVNVTLLFSTEQYLGAAEAYMRGMERRIEAGLDPGVPSVASIFVSRWDVAVADEVPAELRNRLGIAVAKQPIAAYRELLDSERWQRLANEGAPAAAPALREHRHQGPRRLRRPLRRGARGARSRSTRCPTRPCSRSPTTARSPIRSPPTGATPSRCSTEFEAAGVDVAELGARLQREGADAFDRSWNELLQSIEEKSRKLAATG